MSDFLKALQAKTQAIRPVIKKNYNLDKMKNVAIAKAQDSIEAVAPAPAITCRVERVLNRNRLDLFFGAKPSEVVLASLHDNGWHFRPSDKGWYHQDNADNRDYCTRMFSACFDTNEIVDLNPATIPAELEHHDIADPELLPVVYQPAIVTKEVPVARLLPDREIYQHLCDAKIDPYERYQQQCKILAEHYVVPVSDLALLAINELYSSTFGQLN